MKNKGVGQYLSNTLYRALLYVYIHLFADSKFMGKNVVCQRFYYYYKLRKNKAIKFFFIEIRYLQRDRERQGD